ncbi:MAG: hypothetical protein QY331_09075 [Melioribacteraceae bacterium]|nr:MAG: hypothetical protein QY331_09075 [Melioribacteraceae bacterium]
MSNIDDERYSVIDVILRLLNDLITHHTQYKISSKDLISLTKAYHAIKQYPEEVIVGDIDISTSLRWEDGSLDFTSLLITESRFELMKGGSVYTPGVGSDSFTSFMYSSEVEYDNIGFLEQLDVWEESFYSHIDEDKPSIKIEDLAELKESDSSIN